MRINLGQNFKHEFNLTQQVVRILLYRDSLAFRMSFLWYLVTL